MRNSIKSGLSPLKSRIPITGNEWSEKHFKLVAGSSQETGDWESQPFQIAIINMMTNDSIREVYLQKSARVGYTKMLIIALLYMAEHKSRDSVVYQPTDDDAKDFVVDELQPAIEIMPIIQDVFPDWNAENEKNNVKKKKGIGWTIDIKGAHSPKNFRRITKQVVGCDEVDGWKLEVGKEGSPIELAKKRLEGASFPKFIAGTTPTNKGESLIENLMREAELRFAFHLPCKHCDHEQVLYWGGADCDFGMKFDSSLPKQLAGKTAKYQCVKCQDYFYYSDLESLQKKGKWIAEDGTWTKNGDDFFDENGNSEEPPKRAGIYVNSLLSLKLTDGWGTLVEEFLSKKNDKNELKTFINLSLGELFDLEEGEKLDWETLHARREVYPAQVPKRGVFLVGTCDTQDDRLEYAVWAIGPSEEMWLIWTYVLEGDPASEILKKKDSKILKKTFKHEFGHDMAIDVWCRDSGGHYTEEVYECSRRHGRRWVYPTKGHSQYGKPIATVPPTPNKIHKVYLIMVGTDNAKDVIYTRLKNLPSPEDKIQPGVIHFPLDDDICDDVFLKQLTAERKKIDYKSGKKRVVYDAGGRRNEAIDLAVLALVGLKIKKKRALLDLDERYQALLEEYNIENPVPETSEEDDEPETKKDDVDFEAIGRMMSG